jgi:hypothetical protein
MGCDAWSFVLRTTRHLPDSGDVPLLLLIVLWLPREFLAHRFRPASVASPRK